VLEHLFTFTTLSATVLLSIPYVLAALGGVSSERGGVVNIALEGIITVGAFAAAAVTFFTGSPLLGLLGAVLAGIAASALHALITVTVKADQIISGLAVNLLAAGATKFGTHVIWNKPNSDNIATLPKLWTAGPDASGVVTFLHTMTGQPMVLLTIALVVAITLLHTRTVLGLRLRAVGEHAGAADTLGLSVPGLRYTGVLLSGALAGLAGAWLAFNVSQVYEGMSAGKGYIAMAAVVFGRWHPLGATAGCLLFGFSGALAEALERWKSTLPTEGRPLLAQIPGELIGAIPYVLTILALVGLVGRARPPASLGTPYEKGAK
jgi:simple sugar transport system permease protein